MQKKKHKLGLFMLIALVTGNMIGSGIFMLPTEIARIGSIGILSLVFTAMGAMCLALVFAKMSLLIPKTGGPYAYAVAGFGEYIGFQTAYYYWIVLWVGNAAIAVALIGYLSVFFPALANPTSEVICIICIIWALTIINIIGVRSAGAIQIVTTILKFIPLLLIAIIGWKYFHPEYLTQHFNNTSKSNFSAFSFAATLTLWVFVGVESAAVPSGAVSNPERNIPLATLFGTAIAAVIYIASTIAIAGMLPANVLANSTSPFAAAAEIILGKWGKLFIAAGAVISCFGALNGWILLTSHVPMAAAEDGLFPKIFAKKNRAETPIVSLLASSALSSLLLLTIMHLHLIDQFQLLILITSTAALVAYFYTAVSEIIVLPKKNISTKNILHLCAAVFATIYSFWAIFGSSKEIIYYLMAFIFSTIPLYAWYRWKNPKA